MSPAKQRETVEQVQESLDVSERRVCRAMEQPRSTQRYEPVTISDEELLTGEIVRLADRYGRYGYRRITALLRNDGWEVNHKRVERIWRREGLKVPQKQPKRGRLWLNGEIFYSLKEAKVIIELWRKEYNTVRPHSALQYRPPAPEAVLTPQLAASLLDAEPLTTT